MKIYTVLFLAFSFACNNLGQDSIAAPSSTKTENNKARHWEGSFTNGMKQTFISFDISADGKKLENLTFSGYWRCSGKLEQTVLGPEKSFAVVNNKVDGSISEPEDGGATAIRYEIHATFKGNKAEGDFRMNINALGCDTYKLTWTAQAK